MPPRQALAREFLHNPYQVLIGSPDLKANHRITQIFDFPAEHEKYHKLVRILEKVRRGLLKVRLGWIGLHKHKQAGLEKVRRAASLAGCENVVWVGRC